MNVLDELNNLPSNKIDELFTITKYIDSHEMRQFIERVAKEFVPKYGFLQALVVDLANMANQNRIIETCNEFILLKILVWLHDNLDQGFKLPRL